MRLILYKGRGTHPYRWQLRAKNGRVIADGAEGYKTHRNVVRAAYKFVIAWRAGVSIRDLT